MSANGTEISFIRCPSCRSLVPALSTRCRMCGSVLDKDSAAAKNGAAEGVESKEAESSSDPLGDYLEPENYKEAQESGESTDSADPLDELDALLDELQEKKEAKRVDEKSASYSQEKTRQRPVEKKAEVKEDFEKETPVKKASVKELEVEKPKVEKREESKNFVRESHRPRGEKSKLSFSREKNKSKSRPEPRNKRVKSEELETTARISKGAKFQQAKFHSALFGWLVNYERNEGDSLEVRESKFFLTRSSLKKTDLRIDDESISTPHAMLTISSELGFQVQDLMSEQGVFIRRQGASEYELVDDIEVVENGDWLKFGKIEFLVSFLPE